MRHVHDTSEPTARRVSASRSPAAMGLTLPDLAATLRATGLLPPGARILVGVSGGPDSMALLHALARLAPELNLHLLVAHLDHNLREDSAADATFVGDQAARLGVECVVERAEVRGFARTSHRSLEDAGRRARYAFFERVCREGG